MGLALARTSLSKEEACATNVSTQRAFFLCLFFRVADKVVISSDLVPTPGLFVGKVLTAHWLRMLLAFGFLNAVFVFMRSKEVGLDLGKKLWGSISPSVCGERKLPV